MKHRLKRVDQRPESVKVFRAYADFAEDPWAGSFSDKPRATYYVPLWGCHTDKEQWEHDKLFFDATELFRELGLNVDDDIDFERRDDLWRKTSFLFEPMAGAGYEVDISDPARPMLKLVRDYPNAAIPFQSIDIVRPRNLYADKAGEFLREVQIQYGGSGQLVRSLW